MLVCREVSELTTDYLDESLPFRTRIGMRFHLAICSFCRRHLAQVRATIALLAEMPSPPVPQATQDRLVAQMQGEADPPPSPS